MKMKNKILEVEELRELKGQAKVKKHEEFCGREYKERILLVAKIYLDLKGPSTAKEICDYINDSCPVKVQKITTPHVLSSLLKPHKDIGSGREKNRGKKYWIRE